MEVKSFYRKNPVVSLNPNQTIYSLYKELNADNGNLTAVDFFGTKTSFDQLGKTADKLADAYYKAGVREGDCVGIFSINLPLVQQNLIALSKIGATGKWMDVRLKDADLINKINENDIKIAVSWDEFYPNIKNVLSETDIKKIIVASPKEFLDPVRRIFATLKDKKEGKHPVEVEYSKGVYSYTDFLNTGSSKSTLKPVSFEKERPSIIIQSSGSTGVSKSIVHTEYNFNSEMLKEAYSDLPFEKGKRLHVSVPPFIIYGLCNSVYASMIFGMDAVLTPFVRKEAIFDDLGKFDFACGAPFHFRHIQAQIIELSDEINRYSKVNTVEGKKKLKRALKELERIYKCLDEVSAFISGGDKIVPEELLEMERSFKTPIINGYGNNEMCGASILSPYYACKPDSAGIPLKGVDVKAFDPDTYEELPNGQTGELLMSSDSMFKEYVGNPEATDKIKYTDANGKVWIKTGDLGYIDQDGFVYPTGRTRRVIKMDGFKIAPETIEDALICLDFVKDCCVVSAPDEEHVNVPYAYIEKQPDIVLTDDQIKDLIMQQLKISVPDYEFPKYIEVIDEIPYNNGKHHFRVLEERAAKTVQGKVRQK